VIAAAGEMRALDDASLEREAERLRRALAAVRWGRQTPFWRRRAATLEETLIEAEAEMERRFLP